MEAADFGGTLRVVIAEEEPALARALAHDLSRDMRIDVVGLAETARETADLVETLEPHAVVIELASRMGPEAIAAIRRLRQRTRVIAFAPTAREAQDKPLADAFVSRGLPPAELADAVFSAAMLALDLGAEQ